jgi:hypothetical protein
MTSVLPAPSLVANAESQVDAEACEECGDAEHANSVFAGVQGPKADHEYDYSHGDADIGIPEQSVHFLRQKTS